MRVFWAICLLFSLFLLGGCSSNGRGLFSTCDPRYEHCGGANPKMQDEIADEVGQML